LALSCDSEWRQRHWGLFLTTVKHPLLLSPLQRFAPMLSIEVAKVGSEKNDEGGEEDGE